MLYSWLHLFGMLIIILLAAQLFTNGIEHFGERTKISAGVAGSILAAVATALPETLIPILAIIAGSADHLVNEEISVGAILGAPLMLSTLSTGLMASSVIFQRGINGRINPEKSGLMRDLQFFMIALAFASMALFVPIDKIYLRGLLSIVLIGVYIFYLINTFRASKRLVQEGYGVFSDDPLYFSKLLLPKTLIVIILQMLLGFLLLILGAKFFIDDIVVISKSLAISPLLLSILIIPVATELPEKVNSIVWVRKRKDTLAFSNITGAMVFQGTLLPALGILLTPWQPLREVWIAIVVTFIAVVWLRINAIFDGLRIWALLLNGILYLIYLYIMLH